jgi:queuine/archaeosine tRNA-ribosyltransferase
VPLLEGGACGSLGPRDLREIGIEVVAIDVLELSSEVGVDRIRACGGINAWLSWQGPVLAIFRVATTAPSTTGWRGHGLPHLIRERDGELTVKSPVDGTALNTSHAALAMAALAIGAVPSAQLDNAGERFCLWDDAGSAPPAEDLVVSGLAAAQARAGKHFDDDSWQDVTEQLKAYCDCRACSLASGDLLRHLWESREITATHLLTWHNLHRMRLAVEKNKPARPLS